MSPSKIQHLCAYAVHREQEYYIGLVFIPVTSLTILRTLQRPLNESHAQACRAMYANQVDMRSTSPLECVVPLESKNLVTNWVKQQDAARLHKLKPEDLPVLDISGVLFPIVKGQHRYEGYCLAFKDGLIPKDAPHPNCLAVRLFHSGVCVYYLTFI